MDNYEQDIATFVCGTCKKRSIDHGKPGARFGKAVCPTCKSEMTATVRRYTVVHPVGQPHYKVATPVEQVK